MSHHVRFVSIGDEGNCIMNNEDSYKMIMCRHLYSVSHSNLMDVSIFSLFPDCSE